MKNHPNKPQLPRTAYDKLEATLMAKIQDIQGKIEKTEDMDELQKLTCALVELLNSLEKIKKMKKLEQNQFDFGFLRKFPRKHPLN